MFLRGYKKRTVAWNSNRQNGKYFRFSKLSQLHSITGYFHSSDFIKLPGNARCPTLIIRPVFSVHPTGILEDKYLFRASIFHAKICFLLWTISPNFALSEFKWIN